MADEEKKNRRNEWFYVGAFSVIGLVSITSDMQGDLGDQDDETKWSAVSLIIGLGVATIAFFAHALGKLFVGTIIEGFLSLAVFGILAGGLSTIMHPDNDIAQDANGTISNANLYFFSWGALIAATQVFMKYLRDVHNIGASSTFSMMGWGGFAASSFVVMAAATRLHKASDCDDSADPLFNETLCDRTTFAVALGAIGGLFALAWLLVGKFLPSLIDALISFVMMAAWCFGIAKFTFGDNAPAQELGNFYFSSWVTFIMATKLAGDGAGKVFGFIPGSTGEPAIEPVEEKQQEIVHDDKGEKSGEKEEVDQGEKASDEEAGDGHDSA